MRITFLFALLAASCVKTPEKPEPTNPQVPVLTGDPIAAEKQNLLKIVDFKPGDPIQINSPKRFIQVYILFTIMQHEEAQRVSKAYTNDDAIADSLDSSRMKFYADLGISEEAYAEYGKKNGEKIASFLAENIEYQKAYDFIQEQGTEF